MRRQSQDGVWILTLRSLDLCGPSDRLNDGEAFLYLLLFFSFPPLFPSSALVLLLSSSPVLVIHRVDASQRDLTEPRKHGTCLNLFLPPTHHHPPEPDPAEAVWSLIRFPLIRRESGRITSLQARRILQNRDPQSSTKQGAFSPYIRLHLGVCRTFWKLFQICLLIKGLPLTKIIQLGYLFFTALFTQKTQVILKYRTNKLFNIKRKTAS